MLGTLGAGDGKGYFLLDQPGNLALQRLLPDFTAANAENVVVLDQTSTGRPLTAGSDDEEWNLSLHSRHG